MSRLIPYFIEANLVLIVLFGAYWLFFRRDKNHLIRRGFLLVIPLISILLPFYPGSVTQAISQASPLSIYIPEVVVQGSPMEGEAPIPVSPQQIIFIAYLLITGAGLLRLLIQLGQILNIRLKSPVMDYRGQKLYASKKLHASSFFSWIFMDREALEQNEAEHILEHERVHAQQWHSIDRLLAECFLILNWVNPVSWLYRRAVVENLEFLADAEVIRRGCDPLGYQWSILNQYIGSASITNQFRSQIKNRIVMLNKNNKQGSGWKLLLLLPAMLLAIAVVACTENETRDEKPADLSQESVITEESMGEEEVFLVVEDMPVFQGDDSFMEFRKYIATNVKYPDICKEAGVGGKVFVHFIINKEGKVVVPDKEVLAAAKAKSIDEVVVVAYRPLEEGGELPDEKYIQALQEEAIRVVSSSPAWEPGKQRGKNVNVLFTFPINFALK